MTPGEVGILLTQVSAIDNRRLTAEAASEWAHALDKNILLADAQTIVRSHFANSADYLMPVHINAASRAMRKRRHDIHGNDVPFPLDLPADLHLSFRRAWEVAIGDGLEPDAAVHRANVEVGHHPGRAELVGPPPNLAELIAAPETTLKEIPR